MAKVVQKGIESLTRTLGWRVEYLREKENGWTQIDLAERLSKRMGRVISQGYISKIERNVISPQYELVRAMAQEINSGY